MMGMVHDGGWSTTLKIDVILVKNALLLYCLIGIIGTLGILRICGLVGDCFCGVKWKFFLGFACFSFRVEICCSKEDVFLLVIFICLSVIFLVGCLWGS